MGLWYYAVLLFAIFGGLGWIYSSDRLDERMDYQTAAGGLFFDCHRAGIAEAYADNLFGARYIVPSAPASYAVAKTAGKVKLCQGGTAAYNLKKAEIGKMMNVPTVKIVSYRASDLGDMTQNLKSKRFVVTYLEANDTINGIEFAEVQRQIRAMGAGFTSTGLAVTSGGNKYIYNKDALVFRIPPWIPDGSLVTASIIDSNGCPANLDPTGDGLCYKVSTAPASFQDAFTNCKQQGGELAKINSGYARNTLLAVMPAGGWVNGFDTNNDNKFNYYGTNTPLTYTLPNGTLAVDASGNPILPWETGEPNDDFGGGQNCVQLYSNGHLDDDYCNLTKNYVCTF